MTLLVPFTLETAPALLAIAFSVLLVTFLVAAEEAEVSRAAADDRRPRGRAQQPSQEGAAAFRRASAASPERPASTGVS